MRILFAALLLALSVAFTGCVNITGWQTVRGSGNVLSEKREVSGFNRVAVSGVGELTVVQGEDESLTIEADDNLLPLIRSEVSHGCLVIGPREVNLHPTGSIAYRVRVKKLNGVDLSGSVRAQADALRTEQLALAISGSGSMQVAHLDTEELSAHISGSGSASAVGRAQRQEISISGSGNHHAPELKCAEAKVNVSGSGRVSLWVTDSLSAHLSGSAHVGYRGDPRVDSHVSGSGRVERQRD